MKKLICFCFLSSILLLCGCNHMVDFYSKSKNPTKSEVLQEIEETVPIDVEIVDHFVRNKTTDVYVCNCLDRNLSFEAYAYTYRDIPDSGLFYIESFCPIVATSYNTYWYDVYSLYHENVKNVLLNSGLDVEVTRQGNERDTRTSFKIILKNRNELENYVDCLLKIDNIFKEELKYCTEETLNYGLNYNSIVNFDVYIPTLSKTGGEIKTDYVMITPYIFDKFIMFNEPPFINKTKEELLTHFIRLIEDEVDDYDIQYRESLFVM